MIGATLKDTVLLYGIVIVGFSSEPKERVTVFDFNIASKLLLKLGEKISPDNEKSTGIGFWLRRRVSNQVCNFAFTTDLMIIIPCVFGAGILSLFLPRTINGETEKKLKQLELTLHEKLVLTQSCQGMLTQFENVTHQLSLTNTERSQIYDVLLSEQSQISSEIDFTKVQQAFLSSLQTLTRELGDLAGQQPDMLKVYVEMAVQIGEEKKWADETHDKMQQLGQELVLVTSEGIETKTRLEKRVSNLTILVQAATSTHPTKLPSRIQAGGYFLSTPLFLFTQTKV